MQASCPQLLGYLKYRCHHQLWAIFKLWNAYGWSATRRRNVRHVDVGFQIHEWHKGAIGILSVTGKWKKLSPTLLTN